MSAEIERLAPGAVVPCTDLLRSGTPGFVEVFHKVCKAVDFDIRTLVMKQMDQHREVKDIVTERLKGKFRGKSS